MPTSRSESARAAGARASASRMVRPRRRRTSPVSADRVRGSSATAAAKRPPSGVYARCGSARRIRTVAERSALMHEALAGRADQRHGLWKEDAHRVAERHRLLLGAPRDVHLGEPRPGELDGRVEGQRGELLPLGVLDVLGLLLRELAQAPEEILRVASERESEAAFHAVCST